MKKKKDRKVSVKIGDRFGEWKVLSRAEDHVTPSRRSHCWNCVCSCGTSKVVIGSNLIGKRTKHCGCLRPKTPRNNLKPGDKFNRLTLISYFSGEWLCKCDCGKEISIVTNRFVRENTKSCGCLMLESRKKKALLMQAKRTKYSASVASSRRVWKQYCYRDKKCDITFEQWTEISQKKCHYCGIEPNTKYNYFASDSSKPSKKKALEGEFCYNGLDRIDSSKYHTMDNVVPCCYICNRNKSNVSSQKFLQRVSNLKVKKEISLQINEKIVEGDAAKEIEEIFERYGDTDLTFPQFCWLIDQPCYYCNLGHSNNKYRKVSVRYNGLDRVDSNRGHTRDNVVPCCRYCNFGKGKMSLEDWNRWIERVTGYQDEKSKLNR